MNLVISIKAALRGLLLFLTVFPLCGLLFSAPADAARITHFRVLMRQARDAAGHEFLASRSFERDGVSSVLLVDPVTLESSVRPAASVTLSSREGVERLAGTRLLKALERETAPPYRLQNHGATRAKNGADGIFLTTDLCPSKRRFERELYETAAEVQQGGAVPVAVMVSGVWMERHPQELSWLKEQSRSGRLAITWVNHSFTHPYTPKVPLERNFLLTPGTDFDAEVLKVEQLLLENDLVPSPFFRFPGLVSDEATVRRLRELGLIPIGSDAWLAKGERPHQGSFILVHGNGNEPKGVQLALPLLRTTKWRLLPLAAAFGP